MNTHKPNCIHESGEFGTLDNVTGKCWICGKTASAPPDKSAQYVSEIEDRAIAIAKQRDQYRRFIADLAAFIRFGLEHDMSAQWIVTNLAHDIGLVEREMFEGCGSPRCAGYADKEGRAQ